MPLTLAEAIQAEFAQESASTRKMLERLPEDELDWQPHERSMSLARLASHLADLPGWAPAVMSTEELDLATVDMPPTVQSKDELLARWDANVEAFQGALAGAGDADLMVKWRLRSGDQVFVNLPRAASLRGFILSHLYHHRGQLSVFLRLLDVPLPAVYGPTADEA